MSDIINVSELTRKDFPLYTLNKDVNNSKIIYLDHAATSQKPQQVINALITC